MLQSHNAQIHQQNMQAQVKPRNKIGPDPILQNNALTIKNGNSNINNSINNNPQNNNKNSVPQNMTQ